MLDAKIFYYPELKIYTLNILGVSIDINHITFLLIVSNYTYVFSESKEVNIYTIIKSKS